MGRILLLNARTAEVAVGTLLQNDFDYASIDQVAHRPFPMPQSPWFATQSWHDLLFLHWPVDKATLRALVPPGLELDLHNGDAYVAITPFHMTNVAPRGVPAIPGLSNMAELNVRTYVTAKGSPGIYFFSLDCSSAFAVGMARTMFHLPYFTARMSVQEHNGWIEYRTRRKNADDKAAAFEGRYRPVGLPREAPKGSLEYFLTERYCLFTFDDAFHLYRVDIHHGPWNLHLAEAEVTTNTMADAAGIRLPALSPLAHFVKRQDTVIWPLTRVDL